MPVKLVEKKSEFNKVVGHPVQSWEWGEFREKTGNKVVRLGLFSGSKLREGYQLTIHKIAPTPYKLGIFFKGPAPSKEMLETLRELGKEESLVFIRMEPNAPATSGKEKMIQILKKNGAVPGKTSFTPSTFCVDLTKSEDELLKDMHGKTRYNIRLSERKGVSVVEDNSKEAFEEYLQLMAETTKRQGFYAHTEKYHRLMWETLHPAGIARLLTAKYKGETLISWIVFIWKDTLYYPYGASSDRHRNLMASYAMMWEAIKFGKNAGLKKFDLWGREEGKGFTKFKEGFNPEIVEFIGTWDLIINPALYPIYRLAEKVRWILLKAKTRVSPISSFR